MHSSLVRLQNVFGFFTSVMFVVAALIACTDVIAPRTPAAEVLVKDIQVYAFLSPPSSSYLSIPIH
jgi:signal peptidase complex subunit 3